MSSTDETSDGWLANSSVMHGDLPPSAATLPPVQFAFDADQVRGRPGGGDLNPKQSHGKRTAHEILVRMPAADNKPPGPERIQDMSTGPQKNERKGEQGPRGGYFKASSQHDPARTRRSEQARTMMCNKCARASVASTPPVQTLVSWLMSVGWFQRLDCTERGEGWVLLKIPRGDLNGVGR